MLETEKLSVLFDNLNLGEDCAKLLSGRHSCVAIGYALTFLGLSHSKDTVCGVVISRTPELRPKERAVSVAKQLYQALGVSYIQLLLSPPCNKA